MTNPKLSCDPSQRVSDSEVVTLILSGIQLEVVEEMKEGDTRLPQTSPIIFNNIIKLYISLHTILYIMLITADNYTCLEWRGRACNLQIILDIPAQQKWEMYPRL